MPTDLWLNDAAAEVNPGAELEKLLGFARGATAVDKVTNTVAGPTAGVQVTDSAGGTVLSWISPKLKAVTISGTITFNIWGRESANQANTGLHVKIERCDENGNVLSTIVDSEHGTELTTASSARNWTATPTSTALNTDDRLKVTVFGNDAGGNMGSGRTFTITINGPTAAASGDSYVSFSETVEENLTVNLLDSLVAYYKMDEASGTRNDAIGTSHLTDINTVTQTVGKRNFAAQVTRANAEGLTCPDNAAVSMGDIDFAIACWFYLDSLPTSGQQRTIIQRHRVALDSDDDWEFQLELDGDGGLKWRVGNGAGGTARVTIASGLSTATWYFVHVYHDAVNNVIGGSINNAAPTTTSYSGGSYDSDGALHVLYNSNSSAHYDGRGDGVGIWKRVLNSAERSALWNSGNGWDEAELAATAAVMRRTLSPLGTRAYSRQVRVRRR